jgi:hypothetical protein
MRMIREEDSSLLLEIAEGFERARKYMNEESRALYETKIERLREMANGRPCRALTYCAEESPYATDGVATVERPAGEGG